MTFGDARRYAATAWIAIGFHLGRLRYVYVSVLLSGALLATMAWFVFLSPPKSFPSGSIIAVESGASVTRIAYELHDAGVVRSPVLYAGFMRIAGAAPDAGKYVFHKPVGLFTVMYRTAVGGYGLTPMRVAIEPGATVREIARELKEAFPDFDESEFLDEALPLEGYLYPDTYEFYPDLTAEDAFTAMFGNFDAKTASIRGAMAASPHSEKDLLVMASILEKEGRGLEEKRAIAGVLWHRLEIGMPLQVDAVFSYIKDVPLYSPSLSDLKIESPYNTYLNKGLPPGPIGNPSASSMLAAATPMKTTALFYLTGDDGVTRFAKTFDEHKRNRANYLD